MTQMSDIILKSYKKIKPNLKDKTVLTEAASGNYIVTPLLAALSGADVIAFGKDNQYGKAEDAIENIFLVAKQLDIAHKITFSQNLTNIDLSGIDILTNTGMLRPINKEMIQRLNPNAVIPLMWETWEFRSHELDLEACRVKGIKVYGTNEKHQKLKTMNYIGLIVLRELLNHQKTPMSSKILVIGTDIFSEVISTCLKNNHYRHHRLTDRSNDKTDLNDYNVIVFAEHTSQEKLYGINGLIKPNEITHKHTIIHISGNIDKPLHCQKMIPEIPAPFGYMSFTTDSIDPTAVSDLHCAGLKVAEGMLRATKLDLKGADYKDFVEKKYMGMAFKEERYW